MEVAEWRLNQATPGGQQLTIEQEETLASDSRLLACFHLLLNGHEPPANCDRAGPAGAELRRSAGQARCREADRAAAKTESPAAHLECDFLAQQRAGASAATSSRSRRNSCSPNSPAVTSRSALPRPNSSEASAKILTRKAEMLARTSRNLAALDAGLPDKDKRSMGMLLPCPSLGVLYVRRAAKTRIFFFFFSLLFSPFFPFLPPPFLSSGVRVEQSEAHLSRRARLRPLRRRSRRTMRKIAALDSAADAAARERRWHRPVTCPATRTFHADEAARFRWRCGYRHARRRTAPTLDRHSS